MICALILVVPPPEIKKHPVPGVLRHRFQEGQVPRDAYIPASKFELLHRSLFSLIERPCPHLSVCNFAIHTPTLPGSFLPARAAQLGVPKGPLFGKLQRGESVQLPDGRIIRPSDVMEPDTPGPVSIPLFSLPSHPMMHPCSLMTSFFLFPLFRFSLWLPVP